MQNTTTSTRSGTVTVTAGGLSRSFSVSQLAAAPHLTISPATNWTNIPVAGGQRTVNVTRNVPITVFRPTRINPVEFTTDGFRLTAQSNTTTSVRTRTVRVEGGGITRSFNISQLAGESSNFVWHSYSDNVRIHSGIPSIRLVRMWEDSDRGFTRPAVEGWLRDASNAWNPDVPNAFHSGAGAATIEAFAGRPYTIFDELGVSLIGPGGGVVFGLARSSNSGTIDTNEIAGRTRNVQRAARSVIYISDMLNRGGIFSGVNFPERSLYGLRNTTSHEVGHALGFAGHSLNEEDLMRSGGTSNNSLMLPTIRDRTHISQFLNYHQGASGLINPDMHTHVHDYGRVLSPSDRIESIMEAASFASNIVVGSPVAKIQGASEALPLALEGCEILFTDYYFRIANWISGIPGEDIIRVRSQVGDVFEIGSTYTFAAMRVNSVFFDQYNVNSHTWILNNEDVSTSELIGLHGSVGGITVNAFSQNNIFDEASLSDEFVNSIDVAVIATITETRQGEFDNDNFDALLHLNEIVIGEVIGNPFDEFVRLRGEAAVGNIYLILFTSNENGHLTLAARSGAVIPHGSSQFDEFKLYLTSHIDDIQ